MNIICIIAKPLKTALLFSCLAFIALAESYLNQVHASQDILVSLEVGPLLSESNQYFETIKSVKLNGEKLNARKEYIKSLFGGENVYQSMTNSTNKMSNDKLAEQYIRGFDGYITAISSMVFLDGFAKAIAPQAPPESWNAIHMPNGDMVLVPHQAAMTFHAWSIDQIDTIRSAKTRPRNISGIYRATFKGKCPFQDGNVDIIQNDFSFEGRRLNKLLFWGSVGDKQIYMQAAETKYAEVLGPKTKASLHYPSRVSEIYKASIDGNNLLFVGTVHKECKINFERN